MKMPALMRSPYLVAFLLLILAGCDGCDEPVGPKNHLPTITSVTSVPDTVMTGETATLNCTASDPDGNSLTYIWASNQGSFPAGNNEAEVSWQAPSSVGVCTVAVSVNDGRALVYGSVIIPVTQGPVNQPPLPPENPSPGDSASVMNTIVTMQWNCVDPDGDALTYDVFFNLSPDMSTSQQIGNNLSEPTMNLADLQTDTPYYWQVRADDGKGGVTNGPVWMFTIQPGINEPPQPPHSPDPFDGAENVSIRASLNWMCQDPNADPLVYDLFFGLDPDLGEEDVVETGLTEPGWHPDELTISTTYYWKVRAADERGGMTDGEVWSFTTSESSITEQDFLLGNSGLSISMVWIDPGSFMMGAQQNEDGAGGDEYPRHQVTLTQGFWMGKFEVTQDQWTEVAGTAPFNWGGNPNRPAERVTFNAVMNDFLSALNGAETGSPWRLPTEAEWEYACRAGQDENWFPFGSSYAPLDAYAWWQDNSTAETHDVGQKQPNPWGLYDMHGNVWEWCSDFYSPGTYTSNPVTDPQGPDQGTEQVIRGGSWNSENYDCRSANRYSNAAHLHGTGIGFRLVRDTD